jgi:hypothetical protein
MRRFKITAPDFVEPGEGVLFSTGALVVQWPPGNLYAWYALDVLRRDRPDHVIEWIDPDPACPPVDDPKSSQVSQEAP